MDGRTNLTEMRGRKDPAEYKEGLSGFITDLEPVENKDGDELDERVGGHVFEDAEGSDEGGASFADHRRNAGNVGDFGSERRRD